MKVSWKVLLIAALVAAGATSAQAADVDAKAVFKKHCASCHGTDGKGKTRAGRRAGVKDLTDAEYQKKFDDEKIIKIIKEGIEEDGKVKMKPLKDKMTEEEIKAMVPYVRKFKE